MRGMLLISLLLGLWKRVASLTQCFVARLAPTSRHSKSVVTTQSTQTSRMHSKTQVKIPGSFVRECLFMGVSIIYRTPVRRFVSENRSQTGHGLRTNAAGPTPAPTQLRLSEAHDRSEIDFRSPNAALPFCKLLIPPPKLLPRNRIPHPPILPHPTSFLTKVDHTEVAFSHLTGTDRRRAF